jgi:hypothetical protein
MVLGRAAEVGALRREFDAGQRRTLLRVQLGHLMDGECRGDDQARRQRRDQQNEPVPYG